MRTGSTDEARLAVRLASEDPDAHLALAWLLTQSDNLEGATESFERAITMRPRDHLLWLELGKVRDRAGDRSGALRAFGRAVELAPYYAQPRWQFGNALLRSGRNVEALGELRRAAQSDASLYPNFLQIVWRNEGKEARAFAQAARAQTPSETLAVIRFLVKAGAAGEAIRVMRESDAPVSEEARSGLISDLLAAGNFEEAYEVWAEAGGAANRGVIADGGFEETTRTDGEGFGWRFARDAATLNFSLNNDAPRQGSRSLRVEFSGGSDPSAAIVSQLVLVEPGARYRLSFSVRTRDLVTGGLPFVEAASAEKVGVLLASSPPLKSEASDWRDYAFDFNVPAGTNAINVSLRRQPCSGSPCPAFGDLWLDAFELKKL